MRAANHPASVLVLLGAVLSVATVFVYSSSLRQYYSPDVVKRTFAAHGVHLQYATSPDGVRILSLRPVPLEASALQVAVAARTVKVSWGPKLEPYDERFGNVDVTYGGHDEKLLQRVRAAVADLR